MYKIIGADQKEYGPVTADQIHAWITEGRVNGQTSIWVEGATEWKPLATVPEVAPLLPSKPPVLSPLPSYGAQPGLPPDIFNRGYDLDIGRCVSHAWNLLKTNFGLVFGGVAIFMVIQIVISVLAQIPIVGILFTVGNFIISGPLMGGVYYFLLKAMRRQPTDIGDVFAGFRLAFAQLFLGYRSEEHTSELQSLRHLVCRLLLDLPGHAFGYARALRSAAERRDSAHGHAWRRCSRRAIPRSRAPLCRALSDQCRGAAIGAARFVHTAC